ncbi:MAG: hypothetical protein ABIM59_04975 [candidate division WOR-3 bacterium]
MEFRYENLFRPVDFDEDVERYWLRHIMYHLLEEFDLDTAVVIARTLCNLSWYWGVSMERILCDILGLSPVPDGSIDGQLAVLSDAVYDSPSDGLHGAMYVMTPSDVARLHVMVNNVPHRELDVKAKYGDDTVTLFFFDSLPFERRRRADG